MSRRVVARGTAAVVRAGRYTWARVRRQLLALVTGVVAAIGTATGGWAADVDPPLPQRLSETGLYVNGSVTRVRPDNLPFTPQYVLWSDGASKRRWIYLPPGTSIDASNPDAWQFPVGTRFWKEFSHGRPIETRMVERLPSGQWRFATYVWNLQGSEATLAPERGVRALPSPSAPGGLYAVPSQNDCRACHEGNAAPVLGFGALQLSPDRDPNALHVDAPRGHRPLDLRELQARGLLRALPAALDQKAPRISAQSALSRTALGYLHANCGHCHNDSGPLASMDMALLQSTADAPGSARRTWSSLFGKSSRFRAERGDRTEQDAQRIAPGRVDDSTLLVRMSSPHAMSRMPPIGVSVVDAAGIKLIRQWIEHNDFLSSHLKENEP